MFSKRHLALFGLLALAACGGDVKETLGLNKEAPDEFVVVSRPPLVVPPDFDLQPPRPGAEPPHVPTTEQMAHDALLGKTDAAPTTNTGPASATTGTPATQGGIILGTQPATPTLDEFMNTPAAKPKVDTAVTPVIIGEAPSPASATFLKKLGADNDSSDIRSQLQTDLTTPHDNPDAGSLLEQLEGNTKQETIVDPAKEAERLRTNKDDNKAVTEGDTPVIDNSPKSVLDEIKQAF